MDWLPIETAPRDGTPVLIFDVTKSPSVYVCLYARYGMDDGKGGRRIYYECWQEAEGEQHAEFKPTHWMPLPAPPAPLPPA